MNRFGDKTTAPLNGVITGKTLFRGNSRDELSGPYISQYLYLPYSLGNIPIEQKVIKWEVRPFCGLFDLWSTYKKNGKSAIKRFPVITPKNKMKTRHSAFFYFGLYASLANILKLSLHSINSFNSISCKYTLKI